jgi:hypothetical protein
MLRVRVVRSSIFCRQRRSLWSSTSCSWRTGASVWWQRPPSWTSVSSSLRDSRQPAAFTGIDIFLQKYSKYKKKLWGPYTANEGPERIQYKCLVLICVFPENETAGTHYFQNRIIMFCPTIPHSCICRQFMYSQDRSASVSLEYINRIFGTV